LDDCIVTSKLSNIVTLDEAQKQLLSGCLYYSLKEEWRAVPLPNPLSRSIESSETETILYGPKDSFSEPLEQNITLIRRRLPLNELKTETFTVGSLSKTKEVESGSPASGYTYPAPLCEANKSKGMGQSLGTHED
jgi:hypothetical protein